MLGLNTTPRETPPMHHRPRPTAPLRLVATAIALAATLGAASPARADRGTASEALTLYTDAVAHDGEPTPEMLDDVTRRMLEALPKERATSLVIDQMMIAIDDPATSAALVILLDELDLPRGELLAKVVERLAHEDAAVSTGAAAYLSGYLVRPEIDIDTRFLLIELLEPAAAHAAPLVPSLLTRQLLQHGRNTPSMIAAIDRILAIALPDQAARATLGAPGLVALARADEPNLRGLAMLKLGEWRIATPEVVDVLLANVSYEGDDPAVVRRVRIVALQTLGDLAPVVGKLGATIGFEAQRALLAAGSSESDEGLRDLIVHVGTMLGRSMAPPAAKPQSKPR